MLYYIIYCYLPQQPVHQFYRTATPILLALLLQLPDTSGQDTQCTRKRNIEAGSRNHRCRARAIFITYSECVPVAVSIQHAERMRRNIGLFKIIIRVLTTCHTQYTCDSSICIFLFNRTTLPVFVTYLTGALYVHPL